MVRLLEGYLAFWWLFERALQQAECSAALTLRSSHQA